MKLQENFTAVYDDKTYQYTTTVRHKGTVLAFAMDTQQRIYYTVLDNSSADASTLDKNNWLKEPLELTFPTEIRQLGFGGFDQTTMPIVKKNGEVVTDAASIRDEEKDLFRSSTARFTANVPFHVMSDEKHIYVFRQAIGLSPSGQAPDLMVYKQKSDGTFVEDAAKNKIPLVNHTLLLDRFVLAGTTLQRKLEVRYQRSRSKEFPQSSKDSLSAKDMEGKPFYEPTLEIDFIRHLEKGRFTVLLLPTHLPDVRRWQIFAYNSSTTLIDAYNIEQSSEGLFNLRQAQLPSSSPTQYSALSLQSGDYLELCELPVTDSGTFECWVKFDSFDDQIILDASTSVNAPQNAVTLVKQFFVDIKNKNLRFWLEDTKDDDFQGAIASLASYQPKQWYHLAIVWNYNTPVNGAATQIYLNGALVASHTATRAGARPTLRNPYFGRVRHENLYGQHPEKSLRPFQGEVDDVRLWSVGRSAEAIRAHMGLRLRGDRPGLISNLRFGGTGNTVSDQTDYSNVAKVVYKTDTRQNPWVTSTAPIAENLENIASSFNFTDSSGDRLLMSGLSALLYFQQEQLAAGYDKPQKPLKMGARIMLAAATRGRSEKQNHITTVEFAISREGKLAEIPSSVHLPNPTSAGAKVAEQALSTLCMDAMGLTVSGAVLEFTQTNDTPLLFDSANGKLILYFRGLDDQFFSIFYDTKTARAEYVLNTNLTTTDTTSQKLKDTLKLVTRATGFVADSTTVAISAGSAPETCTLTLANLALGVQETWRNLPRDAAKLVNVLSGEASPEPTEAGYYNYSNAEISLSNNGSSQPIDPKKGSMLVMAEVLGKSGQVLDQSVASSLTKTLTPHWRGISPGYALLLNGKDQALRLEDSSKQAKFIPESNLTLEVWINPIARSAPNKTQDRIIQHTAADGSGYTLGIIREVAKPTAMVFSANRVGLMVNNMRPINLANQSFTFEFWARPQNATVSALEVIARHGDDPGQSALNSADLFIGFEQSKFVFDMGGIQLQVQVSSDDSNVWHHWACTFDHKTGKRCIYKDGTKMDEVISGIGYTGTKEVWLGSGGRVDASGSTYFKGALDEFRLWTVARTVQQIQAMLLQPIRSPQEGLLGCWVNGKLNPASISPAGVGQPIIDCPLNVAQPFNNTHWAKTPGGGPTPDTSAILLCRPFVSAMGKTVQTQQQFPFNNWMHVAGVFNQSYALKFDGVDDTLECGKDVSLDINRDLTIEVFLQLDAGSAAQPYGILTKGVMKSGEDQKVPYSLYINSDRQMVFAFEDSGGQRYDYVCPFTLQPGTFYRLAVTRTYWMSTRDDGSVIEGDTITFYQNGLPFAIPHVFNKDKNVSGAGNNNQPLRIGMAYDKTSQAVHFQGTISEVRIWNTALTGNICGAINGQEKGLISWWQLEENKGAIAYDSKSSNHGTRNGGTRWVKNPDPNGSPLTVYCNGEPVPTEPYSNPYNLTKTLDMGTPQFALGELFYQDFSNRTQRQSDTYCGQLEDVRIWKVARTQEQIQDNLFQRLTSDYESLIAYYTFDQSSPVKELDHSYNLLHLYPVHNPVYKPSTAPVSEDIPQVRDALAGVKTSFNDVIHSRPGVQEYGDLQYDTDNNLIGVLKRCHTFIRQGQWHLLTGYKVGSLETEWLGQVQFAPQLIGFIEGAPPVPSENLSVATNDYTGATSVELVDADSALYTYSASRESGFDFSMEYSAGLGIKSSNDVTSGIGIVDSLTELDFKLGGKMAFENSLGFLNNATLSTGKRTTKSSRLDLRGQWKNGRFVPNNVGYALVQSETADVFALRMKHNGALVSYQMRPNPDIPKDWNIITFPINPFYTKQGTLDGKVGLEADVSYPNAKADYNNNISYFKPLEAYGLKNRIRREEEMLKSQYEQYDAGAIGRRQSGKLASADDLMGEVLPKAAKRNIVNTYVWTADGGLFAESEQTMEVRQETNGGSYTFTGKSGLVSSGDFVIFKARVYYELELLFGGHLNLTASKSSTSEKGFSINVNVNGVESDIYERDAQGQVIWDEGDAYLPEPRKQPGKVDAYRFMTFYLQGKEEHFDDFVNKVVDFKWLNTSDHPNAIALRQAVQAQAAAKDKDKSLPWRIMHRVTFCSRVLPRSNHDRLAASASTIEKKLIDLKIDSTWQLVKTLEPFVQGKTGVDFNSAVEQAIEMQLPELEPHADVIIQYMRLYYNMDVEL